LLSSSRRISFISSSSRATRRVRRASSRGSRRRRGVASTASVISAVSEGAKRMSAKLTYRREENHERPHPRTVTGSLGHRSSTCATRLRASANAVGTPSPGRSAKLISEMESGAVVDPSRITVAEFLDRFERDWIGIHTGARTAERYRGALARCAASLAMHSYRKSGPPTLPRSMPR
jgi:hypothetical protein